MFLEPFHRIARTYKTRVFATVFALTTIYALLYVLQMSISSSSMVPIHIATHTQLGLQVSISTSMITATQTVKNRLELTGKSNGTGINRNTSTTTFRDVLSETQTLRLRGRLTGKSNDSGINRRLNTSQPIIDLHGEPQTVKSRLRPTVKSNESRINPKPVPPQPALQSQTKTAPVWTGTTANRNDSGINRKPIPLRPVIRKQSKRIKSRIPSRKSNAFKTTRKLVKQTQSAKSRQRTVTRVRSTGRHQQSKISREHIVPVLNMSKLSLINDITASASTVLTKLKLFVQALPNETSIIFNLLQMKRASDLRALQQLRIGIRKEIKMSTYDHLMLTRKTTKPGRHLHHCTINQTTNRAYYHKVSREVASKLPLKPLIPTPPYNVCSLIGSSGILKGSQCGAVIDKADMIFRFNLAVTSGFEEDVGSWTNITTLNPSILLQKRWGSLKTNKQTWEFVHLLKRQKALIWSPTYGIRGKLHDLSLKTFLRLSDLNPSTKMILADTAHFNAIQAMWVAHGLPHKITTGFYFLSSALSLCNNINLYGFWPFDQSPDGKNVSYHYYDDSFLSVVHNGLLEMKFLTTLHHMGLIKVHIGNCTV